MNEREKIRESFKRALLQTTRALSSRHEVDVAFGGDHASVHANSARIPLPARILDKAAAASARGEGDAAALRLAHHDAYTHDQLAPNGAEARAIFAALENTRCEAIGARVLKGVGDNLAAALDQTIADKGYDQLNLRDAAPLADAAALLLRERLTGRKPPQAAAGLMEAWRDELEERIGPALDALANANTLADQSAFAELAHQLLADLDLDESDRGDQPDDEDNHEDDAEDDADDQNDGDADDQSDVPDQASAGDTTEGDSDMSDQEVDSVEQDDDGASENARMSAVRNNQTGDNGIKYCAYTTEFDEIAVAQDLCDEEELERLRRSLDRQMENLHAVVARLANKLQRKLLAQQNRSWAFDLDEGVLDAARLARVVVGPHATPLLQDGTRSGVSRYCCYSLAR